MDRTKNVTVTKADIVSRHCGHCATKTLHVGKKGNTCLQCIADLELAGCCTLAQYNRWKDEQGRPLDVARGRELR
jgi:hypothetical protein